MSLSGLLDAVVRDPALAEAVKAAADGHRPHVDLLATAAGRVLEERFTPTTGAHCTHCAFRASCSALPEGRQIVE